MRDGGRIVSLAAIIAVASPPKGGARSSVSASARQKPSRSGQLSLKAKLVIEPAERAV